MYLNRVTLIGFLGSDAEKKVGDATNIAVFSLATKTSSKNDAGTWESRTSGIDALPSGSWLSSPATSPRVLTLLSGELRSHEYQREVAVGNQRTSIPQRVWEIRIDSVLKLDRRRQARIERRQP
jgi:single-strand DNA-binding protein